MRSSVVRSSEMWAQWVVAEATGARVHVHDDGSEASMYDLRVGPAADPDVAIEVTGAVDPEFTATWNTGPASGALMLPLRGDWRVTIQPGTYVKQIAPQLEALLRLIEADHDSDIVLPIDHVLRRHNQRIYDGFEAIGVTHVSRYRADGAGKVSFGMSGWGGAVDRAGNHLPAWVGTWLSEPRREDNLRKLAASGAPRREVFIAVTLGGAPWPVLSFLTGAVETAPLAAPALPDPLTGVWVCPTHGTGGVYWDGDEWRVVTMTSGNT